MRGKIHNIGHTCLWALASLALLACQGPQNRQRPLAQIPDPVGSALAAPQSDLAPGQRPRLARQGAPKTPGPLARSEAAPRTAQTQHAPASHTASTLKSPPARSSGHVQHTHSPRTPPTQEPTDDGSTQQTAQPQGAPLASSTAAHHSPGSQQTNSGAKANANDDGVNPSIRTRLTQDLNLDLETLQQLLADKVTESKIPAVYAYVTRDDAKIQESLPRYPMPINLSSSYTPKDGLCVAAPYVNGCGKFALFPSPPNTSHLIRFNPEKLPIVLTPHVSFHQNYWPILKAVVDAYNDMAGTFLDGRKLLDVALSASDADITDISTHLIRVNDYDVSQSRIKAPTIKGMGRTTRAYLPSGEILDADIEIVLSKRLYIVSELGRQKYQGAQSDLLTLSLFITLAHEIGHLLGLAHNFRGKDYGSVTDYYPIDDWVNAALGFFQVTEGKNYDALALEYLYTDKDPSFEDLNFVVQTDVH